MTDTRDSGLPPGCQVAESRRFKSPWADALAVVVLGALTLLFFYKIALTNRVLAGLDVFAYFYPYRDIASEALRAGRLPLWNPYLFMGAPLLANSQVAALYPLHWPLLWLSTPKQIAWTIVLHVWLASAGTYLFARGPLRLRPLAAFVPAVVFALGGFLGAQVEHVNQLNASAWLPWLLLCLEGALGPRFQRERWLVLLCGGGIAGLVLLAGHTQAAYIVFFGAGVYALLRGLPDFRARRWLAGLRGVGTLAVMSLIGAILAAGQLLPTLELSRLSVRSSGLPYNEAASFSLKPGLVFKAFLPPLFWEAPFSEYVAYVGLVGLALAALGTWAILRRSRPGGAILGLALVGLFLAFGVYNPVYYLLYKLVPGFDLFRAPARWLLLYTLGAALLSGIGLEALGEIVRRPAAPTLPAPARSSGSSWARLWQAAIVLLLVLELFLAGRRLAYNRATAPAAFDSLRTAPSHLLAAAASSSPTGLSGELFRFLSMSDIRYDPGDMADLQAMYESDLSQEAIYDLIVATKMKEVLAFNLPLRYRLFSVDGYDGGLLPIDDYVTLERLFLSEDEIWPDGRLRQQLRQVPPARLLSLLNVKFVITDKTQDIWIDDIFYDLEHTVPLGEVQLADLPDFEATHLGVVSYLTGTAGLEDGTPVARVTLTATNETAISATLFAGEHTAEGLYSTNQVAHRPARIGHQWRDDEKGNDYIAVLDLGGTIQPRTIAVRSLLPGKQVLLRGLTLVDKGSGTSRTLSVDPTYKLVHSGDVKIYQNLAVLPRAFIVYQARIVPDESEALALLRDPGFDPSRAAILPHGQPLDGQGSQSHVEILGYEAERVELLANLDSAGYLVLTDTDYPGWVAQVDGNPAPILRADLYFRAVPLDAGQHEVTFLYQPSSVRLGLGLGLATWIAWMLALAVLGIRIGRKSPSSV
jgi:hypothetical protein